VTPTFAKTKDASAQLSHIGRIAHSGTINVEQKIQGIRQQGSPDAENTTLWDH
jgi:hypothetical protein